MQKILVICDDNWHPAEVIRRGLAARQDDRFAFDLMQDAKDCLTPALLAEYPAVVCCKGNSINAANTAPWFEPGVTEVGPAELESYIRAGGGFFAVHAGLAFMNYGVPAYNDLIGFDFFGHPPRCDVGLHVTDPAHPVAAGVEDFTVRDEHYQLKVLAEDAKVFLQSSSTSGGVQPAGYTREVDKGRICALSPGHILSVWQHPMFMRLFTNGLQWVLREI